MQNNDKIKEVEKMEKIQEIVKNSIEIIKEESQEITKQLETFKIKKASKRQLKNLAEIYREDKIRLKEVDYAVINKTIELEEASEKDPEKIKKLKTELNALEYMESIIYTNIGQLGYIIFFKIAIEFFKKMESKKINRKILQKIENEYTSLLGVGCRGFDIRIEETILNGEKCQAITFNNNEANYKLDGLYKIYIFNNEINTAKVIKKLKDFCQDIELYNFGQGLNGLNKFKSLTILKAETKEIAKTLRNDLSAMLFLMDTII